MFSKWLMSTIALLVVDVRTGAIQQATTEPQQCYSCAGNSTSPCNQPNRWSTLVCPTTLPICATTAASPDFASSLTCAAAAGSPCSLKYITAQTYQVTCLCNGQLCNAPFSTNLRNQLLNISYSETAKLNDSAKLIEMFFNLSTFANVSGSDIYRAATVEVAKGETFSRNSSELIVTSAPIVSSTHSLQHSENVVPRAEALKQEVTAPSDDDEDEAEGSGTYEERQSQPASPPAAPSSYLPAENTATSLLATFFTSVLFVPIIV